MNSWHLITIYLPTYPNRVFSLHMRSPATATHPAVTAVRKFQGYENPTNAKHVPQHCREQSINVMNAVPSERRPLTTSNTCIICIIYIHNSTYIHILYMYICRIMYMSRTVQKMHEHAGFRHAAPPRHGLLAKAAATDPFAA